MHETGSPFKFNIFFGFPSYGGNGGISSEVPDIREWMTNLAVDMRKDPRIGEVTWRTIGDTPVTMVRNRFVRLAREHGAHVLVMADSDMKPDLLLGRDPSAEPFFQSSFDFLVRHYGKGPCMIGAPYCGPPDVKENVYVFHVESNGSKRGDETRFSLEQFTRQQAALMTGISEVAALPTGLIMYDMRLFDLTDPVLQVRQMLEEGRTLQEANRLAEPWFSYEYPDCYQDRKASTEDVVNTRNISFKAADSLGYNPTFCNWDAWAGHYKPWCVGKPEVYRVEHAARSLRVAIDSGIGSRDQMIDLDSANRDVSLDGWGFRDTGVGRALTAGPLNGGSRVGKSLSPDAADPPIVRAWKHEHALKNGPLRADDPRFAEHHAALEIVPTTEISKIVIREVNGQEVLNFGHMTNPTHLQALRDLLEEELDNLRGKTPGTKLNHVEVGSWLGESALAVVDLCGRLICVDTWEGTDDVHDWNKWLTECLGTVTAQEIWRHNLRGHHAPDGPVERIKLPSVEAAAIAPSMNDTVLIDANHSYESTLQDIEAWLPRVRTGGLLIGHDFGATAFPGVRRAVEEVFGPEGYQTRAIVNSPGGHECWGGYWFHRVVGSRVHVPAEQEASHGVVPDHT